MNFTIKNTRIEDEKLIVFYELSNGDLITKVFDSTAKISDIISEGENQVKLAEAKLEEIKRLEEEVKSEIIDVNLTREKIEMLEIQLAMEKSKLDSLTDNLQ